MQATYKEPDELGYYGEFGGAYIPEMLYRNVEELRSNYLDIINSESFQKEYRFLLKDYAGRETPLYYASRLSDKYHTNIYLKREDQIGRASCRERGVVHGRVRAYKKKEWRSEDDMC